MGRGFTSRRQESGWCLAQLCTKYRLVSTALSPYHCCSKKEVASLKVKGSLYSCLLVTRLPSGSRTLNWHSKTIYKVVSNQTQDLWLELPVLWQLNYYHFVTSSLTVQVMLMQYLPATQYVLSEICWGSTGKFSLSTKKHMLSGDSALEHLDLAVNKCNISSQVSFMLLTLSFTASFMYALVWKQILISFVT